LRRIICLLPPLCGASFLHRYSTLFWFLQYMLPTDSRLYQSRFILSPLFSPDPRGNNSRSPFAEISTPCDIAPSHSVWAPFFFGAPLLDPSNSFFFARAVSVFTRLRILWALPPVDPPPLLPCRAKREGVFFETDVSHDYTLFFSLIVGSPRNSPSPLFPFEFPWLFLDKPSSSFLSRSICPGLMSAVRISHSDTSDIGFSFLPPLDFSPRIWFFFFAGPLGIRFLIFSSFAFCLRFPVRCPHSPCDSGTPP